MSANIPVYAFFIGMPWAHEGGEEGPNKIQQEQKP